MAYYFLFCFLVTIIWTGPAFFSDGFGALLRSPLAWVILLTPFFCLSIAIGLFLKKDWANVLGKYVYVPLSIFILGFGAFLLAALSGPMGELEFILLFLFCFNGLGLFFLLPALLYFYAPVIKRIHPWLKILLLLIYIAPIIVYLLINAIIPTIQKKRQVSMRYPVHLAGTVINVETKQPVANAPVGVFYQLQTFETATNAAGAFKIDADFKSEKPNIYGIYVKKDGYIHHTVSEPYTPEQKTMVLEVFEQEQNIILPQGSGASLTAHGEAALYFSMAENAFVPDAAKADLIITAQELKAPEGGGIKPAAPGKDIAEITACGGKNYEDSVPLPGKNGYSSCFCLKTKLGHYAKIEIKNDQISLWVLQPDGTDNLRTKITYQYPLKHYCEEHTCAGYNVVEYLK